MTHQYSYADNLSIRVFFEFMYKLMLGMCFACFACQVFSGSLISTASALPSFVAPLNTVFCHVTKHATPLALRPPDSKVPAAALNMSLSQYCFSCCYSVRIQVWSSCGAL